MCRFGGNSDAGIWRGLLIFFAVLLAMGLPADAANIAATATLSRPTATVNQPVRLEIRIDGASNSNGPPDVRVEGLEIRYIGEQTRIQMENFNMRTSVIHSYQVMPLRAGEFTIPAVQVEADGQRARTHPVALRVQGGSSGYGSSGGQGGTAPSRDQVGWAEIVLPKQTAYVGEALPVELRLYVDSRVRWRPESMPDLEGEGFTKTKIPEPRQEQARKDGRDFDVLVFRTAITPSRAGKVRIGPADIVFNASIPRARAARPSSPFDDEFFQDFFNDPLGAFGRAEQRKATAQAVELDVKPLPTTGRPPSFAGAVGKYSIAASGSPNRVNVGDPLTMKVEITGTGNFDRVTAPAVSESAGWRAYPSSAQFQPEDEIALRGTKTFETAVIPLEKKTEMPRFEFSYFDPATEKYVVLKTDSIPLTVEGEAKIAAPPAASPRVQTETRPSASTPPPPTPMATAPDDILGLRYDADAARSFTALYETPGFWWAQILPAAGLAGLLGAKLWRRPAPEVSRAAELRREKSALQSRLRRARGREEFLDTATRLIQVETAIATGQSPSSVDATTASRSRRLAPEAAATIDELFAMQNELRYAGAVGSEGELPESQRSRFLAAVAQFEKTHAKS